MHHVSFLSSISTCNSDILNVLFSLKVLIKHKFFDCNFVYQVLRT